jgi:hypothetical protein
MQDHRRLTELIPDVQDPPPLFVLVEVKAGKCSVNGPWSRPEESNMERVIRRMGFAMNEKEVLAAADSMYATGRSENEYHVLQYICIGRETDEDWQVRLPQLVQITWREIAEFFAKRFRGFPEKIPEAEIHEQWPQFGRELAEFLWRNRASSDSRSALMAVRNYIDHGSVRP